MFTNSTICVHVSVLIEEKKKIFFFSPNALYKIQSFGKDLATMAPESFAICITPTQAQQIFHEPQTTLHG